MSRPSRPYRATHHKFYVTICAQGGVDHTVQIDTGSTGIVIPASVLHAGNDVNNPLLAGVTKGPAGKIVYQPSDDTIAGNFYRVAALQIGKGSAGYAGTVCDVIVLGADNVGPQQGMMGIGFGRPIVSGKDSEDHIWALDNPFLNCTGMAAGSAYASYLLADKGIWVGYVPWDLGTLCSGTTFGFQKLSPQHSTVPTSNNSNAWQEMTATIALSGVNTPDPPPGAMLLDTGVPLMMLELTNDGWTSKLNQATLTVTVPGNASTTIMTYSFEIVAQQVQTPDTMPSVIYVPAAGSTAMAPQSVLPRQVGATTTDFVNTGINVLQGYRYYFDAVIGQVGFAAKPS